MAALGAVAAHALAGGVGGEERGSGGGVAAFEGAVPLGKRVGVFREGFIERGEGGLDVGGAAFAGGGSELDGGRGNAIGGAKFVEFVGEDRVHRLAGQGGEDFPSLLGAGHVRGIHGGLERGEGGLGRELGDAC